MESSVNAHTEPTKRRRSPWLFRLSILTILGMGALFMIGRVRPKNLGVSDGKLAVCPESPNCVSTQAQRESQFIEPLRIVTDDIEKLTLVARNVILKTPRWKFVTQEPDYCHIECVSLICRYVDDLEIWIDKEGGLIHSRSASRVGYSDMGVNRKRVQKFFDRLVQSGLAARE